MAYSVITPFVSLEQPTLSKWNAILANQVAFNNGTGIPSANALKAIVLTTQTTTSATYVRLSTTTDEVAVTIGSTGMAIVMMKARSANNGVNYNYIAPALSGANTLTAANAEIAGYYAQETQMAGSNYSMISLCYLHVGLAAGSTTFSMSYKTSASTASFGERVISVIPL